MLTGYFSFSVAHGPDAGPDVHGDAPGVGVDRCFDGGRAAGVDAATPGRVSVPRSDSVHGSLRSCRIHAPAPPPQTNTDRGATGSEHESILGLVPHQLRGFLAQFRNVPIVGAAYDRCTGCSETVVKAYEEQGFEMLLKAFNDTEYLPELTGLKQMYEETQAALENDDLVDAEGDDF